MKLIGFEIPLRFLGRSAGIIALTLDGIAGQQNMYTPMFAGGMLTFIGTFES